MSGFFLAILVALTLCNNAFLLTRLKINFISTPLVHSFRIKTKLFEIKSEKKEIERR